MSWELQGDAMNYIIGFGYCLLFILNESLCPCDCMPCGWMGSKWECIEIDTVWNLWTKLECVLLEALCSCDQIWVLKSS